MIADIPQSVLMVQEVVVDPRPEPPVLRLAAKIVPAVEVVSFDDAEEVLAGASLPEVATTPAAPDEGEGEEVVNEVPVDGFGEPC